MQTTNVTFLAGELPLAKCSKLHLFAFSGVKNTKLIIPNQAHFKVCFSKEMMCFILVRHRP